jgi:RNA polymerase sigma factor (sigma-70 family)
VKPEESAIETEKSNPEDFFTELYNLYGNKVYNIAYGMTGDNSVSEDIVQETFIKVFKGLSGFRGDSHLFTWIYAIARNICLRHLERNKRRSFASIEKLIGEASQLVSRNKYDEHENLFYINQVKDGCLLGVLRCLSFNQRLTFILHILCDIPIGEVSSILDKSENSTRILLHRGRKNIRKFLCDNCSLYNDANSCRCENLISFSLEKGWIAKYNPTIDPEVIESEIKAFKDEIALYRSISFKKERGDLKAGFLSIIREQKYKIFSDRKVK